MDPITLAATILTVILGALSSILGAKYNKFKKNFIVMMRLIKELEKVLEDGEVTPAEVKSLINSYKANIK